MRQRDTIVGSSAPGDSVSSRKIALSTGSSNDLSSAFCALSFMRSACSMIAMCLSPS